jgi:hypothetical protein
MRLVIIAALISLSSAALANTRERVETTIKANFPEVVELKLKRKVLDEHLPWMLNPTRKNDVKRVYSADLVIQNADDTETLNCRVFVFKGEDIMSLSCNERHRYYKVLKLQ